MQRGRISRPDQAHRVRHRRTRCKIIGTHEANRSIRSVVRCQHPCGSGLARSPVHNWLAQHSLQRLDRNPTWPQEHHLLANELHDGRLHAYSGAASINHRVNAALEVGQHMVSTCRAHVTEAVGAGSGHTAGAQLGERGQHSLGHGMVWHTYPDTVSTADYEARDTVGPRQDQGQRAGPKRIGQKANSGVGRGRPIRQLVDAGEVHDERVTGGATFGLEDLGDRVVIGGIGAEPVDRFGRQTHGPAFSKDRCGPIRLMRLESKSGLLGCLLAGVRPLSGSG